MCQWCSWRFRHEHAMKRCTNDVANDVDTNKPWQDAPIIWLTMSIWTNHKEMYQYYWLSLCKRCKDHEMNRCNGVKIMTMNRCNRVKNMTMVITGLLNVQLIIISRLTWELWITKLKIKLIISYWRLMLTLVGQVFQDLCFAGGTCCILEIISNFWLSPKVIFWCVEEPLEMHKMSRWFGQGTFFETKIPWDVIEILCVGWYGDAGSHGWPWARAFR